MFYKKKKFLRNFANSQKNTCARVSFLIKLQASKHHFFIEHLWWLLLRRLADIFLGFFKTATSQNIWMVAFFGITAENQLKFSFIVLIFSSNIIIIKEACRVQIWKKHCQNSAILVTVFIKNDMFVFTLYLQKNHFKPI